MADVYSNRSNARRAAEAMIAKGTAPAAKYGLTTLSTVDGGEIKIDWQIEAAPQPQPQSAQEPVQQPQPQPQEPAPQPKLQLKTVVMLVV
jgi:hypothetical protein